MLFVIGLCQGAEDWGAAQFLVGQWKGKGGGKPGHGVGAFSFAEDLQGKVLLRKSYSEYPAANGRAAFRHEDLMVVYKEDGALRAMYFDSEGHVIRYGVMGVDGGVAFVSDGPESAVRYRLSYLWREGGEVTVRFEVAPPGKAFGVYVEGVAQRQ
jgi:hypothetical protein